MDRLLQNHFARRKRGRRRMTLKDNQKGSAVLAAVIVIGVLLTLGLVSLSISLRNYRGVQQRITEQKEYYETTVYIE